MTFKLFANYHVLTDIIMLWKCFLSSVCIMFRFPAHAHQWDNYWLCKSHIIVASCLFTHCYVFTDIITFQRSSLSCVHRWSSVGTHMDDGDSHLFCKSYLIVVSVLQTAMWPLMSLWYKTVSYLTFVFPTVFVHISFSITITDNVMPISLWVLFC